MHCTPHIIYVYVRFTWNNEKTIHAKMIFRNGKIRRRTLFSWLKNYVSFIKNLLPELTVINLIKLWNTENLIISSHITGYRHKTNFVVTALKFIGILVIITSNQLVNCNGTLHAYIIIIISKQSIVICP